ncbi:hypothetical protein [Teredinibacter sp. KSP-S5-2]|uniref:hypothetical protein n=1 Tax=Teredinibacter sp. KSP-S5-2 TaxID=3034506 RepID=UPI0029343746|nr:hypothetical protein [Teredinibacter sp. KSP-S5-2]WNO08441.1 hypothetical protein P5V12_15835 [Teredinibacter sp. KSP-S5-2]
MYPLILSALIASSSYATKMVCPTDTHEAFQIGLEEASEEGFAVKLYDIEKVDSGLCRVVNIVVPATKNEKPFSGTTLILQKDGSYAGQYDIVPSEYEGGSKYGVTFEACNNSSSTVIVAIFYGENCNTSSYAVSIQPWSM